MNNKLLLLAALLVVTSAQAVVNSPVQPVLQPFYVPAGHVAVPQPYAVPCAVDPQAVEHAASQAYSLQDPGSQPEVAEARYKGLNYKCIAGIGTVIAGVTFLPATATLTAGALVCAYSASAPARAQLSRTAQYIVSKSQELAQKSKIALHAHGAQAMQASATLGNRVKNGMGKLYSAKRAVRNFFTFAHEPAEHVAVPAVVEVPVADGNEQVVYDATPSAPPAQQIVASAPAEHKYVYPEIPTVTPETAEAVVAELAQANAELEAENAVLRAEVADLKQENQSLRATLESMLIEQENAQKAEAEVKAAA